MSTQEEPLWATERWEADWPDNSAPLQPLPVDGYDPVEGQIAADEDEYGRRMVALERQYPDLDAATMDELSSSTGSRSQAFADADAVYGAVQMAFAKRRWNDMGDDERRARWDVLGAAEQSDMVRLGYETPDEIAQRKADKRNPFSINLPDKILGINTPDSIQPFGSSEVGRKLGTVQHEIAGGGQGVLDGMTWAADKALALPSRLMYDNTWAAEHDREITLNEVARSNYERQHGAVDDDVWAATREEALRVENEGGGISEAFENVHILGLDNAARDLDPSDDKNADLRGPAGVAFDPALLEVMLQVREDTKQSAGLGEGFASRWNRTYHGESYYMPGAEAMVASMNGGKHITEMELKVTRYNASGRGGEFVDGIAEYLVRDRGMDRDDPEWQAAYQQATAEYYGDGTTNQVDIRNKQAAILADYKTSPGRFYARALGMDPNEGHGALVSGGWDAFMIMAMDPADRVLNNVQRVRAGMFGFDSFQDARVAMIIGRAEARGEKIPDVVSTINLGSRANRRILDAGNLPNFHPVARDALESQGIPIVNLTESVAGRGNTGIEHGVRGARQLTENLEGLREATRVGLHQVTKKLDAATNNAERVGLNAALDELSDLSIALDHVAFTNTKVRTVTGVPGALGRHFEMFKGPENVVHLSGARKQYEMAEAIAKAVKGDNTAFEISMLLPRGLDAVPGLAKYDDWLKTKRGYGVEDADDIIDYLTDSKRGLQSMLRGQFGMYEAPFMTLPHEGGLRYRARTMKNWGNRTIDWAGDTDDLTLHGRKFFGHEVAGRIAPEWASEAFQRLVKAPVAAVRVATTHWMYDPFINLTSDNFVSEMDRLTKIGLLGRNPMTARRRYHYLDEAIAAGDMIGRRQVVRNFLDELMDNAGLADNDEYRRLVQAFDDQSYSVGNIDVIRIQGRNVKAATIADTQHAAGVRGLDLSEFFQISRKSTFSRQFYGAVNNRHINTLMQSVWKPAVLLRVGFPFRAGGEEAISFILREGPTAYFRAQAALWVTSTKIDPKTGLRVINNVLPMRALTGGTDIVSYIAGRRGITRAMARPTIDDIATAQGITEGRFFAKAQSWMEDVAVRNKLDPKTIGSADTLTAYAHFYAAYASEWLRSSARTQLVKLDRQYVEAAEELSRVVGWQSAVLSNVLGTASYKGLMPDFMQAQRGDQIVHIQQGGEAVAHTLNPAGWVEYRAARDAPELLDGVRHVQGKTIMDDPHSLMAFRYKLHQFEDSEIVQAMLREISGALSERQIADAAQVVPSNHRIASTVDEVIEDRGLASLASTNVHTGRVRINEDALKADWDNGMAYLRDSETPTGMQKQMMLDRMGVDVDLLYQHFRDNGGLDAYRQFILKHEEGHLALEHTGRVDLLSEEQLLKEIDATRYAFGQIGLDPNTVAKAQPPTYGPVAPSSFVEEAVVGPPRPRYYPPDDGGELASGFALEDIPRKNWWPKHGVLSKEEFYLVDDLAARLGISPTEMSYAIPADEMEDLKRVAADWIDESNMEEHLRLHEVEGFEGIGGDYVDDQLEYLAGKYGDDLDARIEERLTAQDAAREETYRVTLAAERKHDAGVFADKQPNQPRQGPRRLRPEFDEPLVDVADLNLNQLRRLATEEGVSYNATDVAATLRARITGVRNGTVKPADLAVEVGPQADRALHDLTRFAERFIDDQDQMRKILHSKPEEVRQTIAAVRRGGSGDSDLHILLNRIEEDLASGRRTMGPTLDEIEALNDMERGVAYALISEAGPRRLDDARRTEILNAATRRLMEDDMRHYVDSTDFMRVVNEDFVEQPLKAGHNRWFTPLVKDNLHEALATYTQLDVPTAAFVTELTGTRAARGMPPLTNTQLELVERIYAGFDPFLSGNALAGSTDGYSRIGNLAAVFDPADSRINDNLNGAIDAISEHFGLGRNNYVQGYYDMPKKDMPSFEILGDDGFAAIGWDVGKPIRVNPEGATAEQGIRQMVERTYADLMAHMSVEPGAGQFKTIDSAGQHSAGLATNPRAEFLHELGDSMTHGGMVDADLMARLPADRAPVSISGPKFEAMKNENPLQGLVRAGFDEYVSPAVSLIARQPMFLHLYAQQRRIIDDVLDIRLPPEKLRDATRIANKLGMEDTHELNRAWRQLPEKVREEALDDALSFDDFSFRLDAVIKKIDESDEVTDTTLLNKLAEMNSTDYDQMWRYQRTRNKTERLVSDIAIDRALADSVPFIDDHRFKSQFSVINRNLAPFWFAQEQFYKRWARTAIASPQSIRRGHLGMMALRNGGFMHKDKNGEDVYVIPGAEGAWDLFSSNPLTRHMFAGGDLPGVPGTFEFRAEQSMPGLNSSAFGREGFAPTGGPVVVISALSIDAMTGDWGPANSFADAVTTPVQRDVFSNSALYSVMPSWMSRALDYSLNSGRGDEEQAAAWKGAISQMFSAGLWLDGQSEELRAGRTSIEGALRELGQDQSYLDGLIDKWDATGDTPNEIAANALEAESHVYMPPDNATPHQLAVSRNRLKDFARNYMGARFVLGFMTPATPRWSNGDWELSKEYQSLVENMDYEDAMLAFNIRHPGIAPLMTSTTERESGASLPPTQAVLSWMEGNQDLLEEFPLGAPWLAHQNDATDDFSRTAWNTQLEMDLRSRKTPEQFYDDIVWANSADAYFRRKASYEEEQILIQDPEQRKASKRNYEMWRDVYLANNEIFAQRLQNVDNNNLAVVNDIQRVLEDPRIEDTPHVLAMRELMDAYQLYSDEVDLYRGSSTGHAQEQRHIAKGILWATGERIVGENPTVDIMWNTLIMSQAELKSFDRTLEVLGASG